MSNMSVDFQLTLSLQDVDVCNVTELKSTFSKEDCVTVSGTGMGALKYRSHYTYVPPPSSLLINAYGIEDDPPRDHCACLQSVGSEYDLCLDLLCNKPAPCEYTSYDRAPNYLLLPLESSTKNDVCSYSLVYQGSDNVSCLEEYRCNWNPSLSVSKSSVSGCAIGGDEDGMFCGARFTAEDVFYREIVNVTEEECGANGWKVCVTPLGSISVGEMSESNCVRDGGYCTVDCPNQDGEWKCLPVDRTEPSVCYNDSDEMNETKCDELSGEWRGEGEGNVCVLGLQNNLGECERNGNVFVECESLDVGECESNEYVACYVSESLSVCESERECEESGRGRCTDSDYFVNYLTSPPTNGSCVVPFEIDITDENRQFCYQNTIPLSFGYG